MNIFPKVYLLQHKEHKYYWCRPHGYGYDVTNDINKAQIFKKRHFSDKGYRYTDTDGVAHPMKIKEWENVECKIIPVHVLKSNASNKSK